MSDLIIKILAVFLVTISATLQIVRGDLVLSRNLDTGVQEYKPVLQTFITHPSSLYYLSYT